MTRLRIDGRNKETLLHACYFTKLCFACLSASMETVVSMELDLFYLSVIRPHWLCCCCCDYTISRLTYCPCYFKHVEYSLMYKHWLDSGYLCAHTLQLEWRERLWCTLSAIASTFGCLLLLLLLQMHDYWLATLHIFSMAMYSLWRHIMLS